MRQIRKATGWLLLLVAGFFWVPRTTAQQYYYFETNQFPRYEGGVISGTLHRAVLDSLQNVCILFYTNVSGITPVNAGSDVTGLVTSGACFQPGENIVLAQFNAGSHTANFSLNVVNNGTVQTERGALLYMGSGWAPPAPSTNYIQQAWVFLEDNDSPVTITRYTSAVSEGSENYFFFERSTNSLHAPMTVRFTLSGSATLNTDYQISAPAPFTLVTGATNTLTIPESYDYGQVNVTVLRDALVEGDETVTARIEPNAAHYTMPGSPSLTITNWDDTPAVSVSLINSKLAEGTGQIGFVVSRSYVYTGGNSLNVNLSVGGTATAGMDYTPSLSTTATIPSSQFAVTNWITPLTDTLVEGVETVSVTVFPGDHYVVDGAGSNAVAQIEDDYPVINVQAADNYAAEPTTNAGVFTITRLGNFSKAVTVQLNVTGTATPGVDYVALPSSVTLGVGASTTNLTVTPLTNGGAETAETVVLSLNTNASYFLGLYTNAVVTITGEGTNPRDGYPLSERYVRGRGTNYSLSSMVIPLDGIEGTRRSDLEAFGFTTGYHYNATNPASQAFATNRVAFNTPIASFGGDWGTPFYVGQSYSLGIYQGTPTADPIIIYAFRRSDGGLDGTVTLEIPGFNFPTNWIDFTTNGFARTVNGFGLTTVLRSAPDMNWGTGVSGWVLTHTATDAATNYIYLAAAVGLFSGQAAVLNAANQPAYGYFYDMKFEPRPGWRSVFIDQPHFQSSPLPPSLLNKTPEELLNFGALVTNSVSLSPSACTNLDLSPELRRHPLLNQFVADLNNDPLALANYVQNEIDLTDPIAYRDDGQVQIESVNQGGINRGALGVYLESQGSPTEQCALLIYLLRQAGYPAAYVFPPEGGLKMLDTRLSALLRMRINDGQDKQGRLFATNQLITVNYPWVAAYISNQWIHLFPWLKDHSVEEGLDLADFLPDPYKQTQLWVRDYVLGKTNILAFALPGDDTVGTIFPRWLDNALKQNAPGVSIDDIGMRYVNRRHLYTGWSDFPRPTWVTNTSTALESLGVSTNLFDTVQVQLYSVANPQKSLLTPPLRMADLHNRKFFLTHTNLGNGQVQAQLILGPYLPGNTNQGTFSAGDTTLTNRQMLALTFDGTDDNLKVRLRHRRQRALDWGTALDPDRGFLDLLAGREVAVEKALRVGDVAAICFNPGRVTPAMQRVHAQELWNMEQMLSTNSVATNLVSADVYQGSLSYLMGMSYYERAARHNEFYQRLFKTQNLSWFAMGLAKLSPRRNPNGTLYNGPLDPIWPNVDMFFQEVVGAGNGTVRLDSGWSRQAARQNYFSLVTADLSAEEHATLNIFFGQSNAVSTVNLLQLAQSKVASGGSNVVALNVFNFESAGDVLYGGIPLKFHDPGIWADVASAFQASSGFVMGWITPGIQTTPSGSFSGMAALLLSPVGNGAFIGNNQYGGYADALANGSVSAANSPWIEIRGDGDGNYTSTYSSPSANQNLPGNETTTLFDLLAEYALYNNNAYAANPNQSFQGILNGLMLNGSAGSYQNTLPGVTDTGLPGTKTDYRGGNGLIAQVEDPVNALTGEFYIDEVDLSLPGPMPLQVRRNYGSQNLAPNQLGYGWKLNYLPYLSLAASNIIYVAEADGSVLAFDLIGTNLWSPTLALNPTLNNNSAGGIGSAANRRNARLTKVSTNYFLTGGDGSLRVFQEMNFPLTNSPTWDRLRPYLTFWYDNRSNFYRFEYGTNATAANYGQVRRVVSSSGNVLRFEYDVYGRIVDAYSLDGRRVQYDYDQHGDLVTVIRPDTSEIRYEYQLLSWSTNSVTNIYSTHLLVNELRPDGRTLKNEYDGQRRVTNQWSTVGPDLRLVRNATFRYTNDFNLTNLTATLNGTTTILDYTNNATTYHYTNGLIRRISYPAGTDLVQTWYEAHETNAPAYPRSLKTVTDKRGLVTTYFYDSSGNFTNATSRGDLLGDGNTNTTATTLAFYGTNNLPTRTVDASGNTNLFFYTNTWLLARVEIWPSNATPAQAITNLYTYGNVTNPTDGTVSYGLRVQEVRAAFSPDAATTEWAYSSRGFRIRQVRYPGTGDPAVIVTNLFNYRGELAQQTDVAGRSFTYGFDPLGNLQSREVYNPGQSVPLAWDYLYYNENGELTWSDGPRFDPEDYVWRDYDGAGRQTQEIRWRSQARADGTGVEAVTGDDLYATTFYEYDPFGNLIKAADPRGNYSRNKYDALGRLLREEFYDAQGVLLATNGFAYNPAGDVTNAFNALGGSTQRQFTGTGKPKFQRHADGSTNAWLYYADGRIRREIQNNGAYWESAYDDANRRTTRIFHSAAGSPLATNRHEFDRRGNLVKRTDAGGFVFTNLYDGLDRIKVSAGPAIVMVKEECAFLPGCGNWVTNVLQQTVKSYYDAAGITITNVNALGEKTVSHRDALGRLVRIETRDTNNALVRVTTAAFAQNHHGVTITNGSGSSAIVSTIYTDNDGQRSLSVAYPWANVREFTLNDYDLAGNLTFEGRYVTTNSATTFFSGAVFEYDGLNRLKQKWDRDDALTTLAYNSAGNVTNRTMPGGLQWTAIYNSAGQMVREWNTGAGGAGTRTNIYAYYPSGHVFAGLLQTTTNALGIWCTYDYDDYLRTETTVHQSPQASSLTQETSWTYDARGLLTGIAEFLVDGTVNVSRSYDAYGQLVSETTAENDYYSVAGQISDAAGRRTRLTLNNVGYDFNWRADGLLSTVAGPGASASYSYNTAGILTNRLAGSRSTAVSSFDGVGRPLSITTKASLSTKLTETLAWTGDGLLNTHTLAREDFTNAAAYSYASLTRRLTEERLNLNATKRWTNSFTFDGGGAGGPGALTKVGPVSGAAQWSGGTDAFSRINAGTNTFSLRYAYGRANGPSTIIASLDGQAVPVSSGNNFSADWPIVWRATLDLPPGAHQLSVSAVHPSGQFTTNRSVWFTNNIANETVSDLYDAAGRLTLRVWKNPNGTTNRTETLVWDLKNRLWKVNGSDTHSNSWAWYATYDAFGRKLYAETSRTTNGTYAAGIKYAESYYDPAVEFLELGVTADGASTWKLYGPDLNGVYGGMNGVGGLEGTITGSLGEFQPTISDARGNVLGAVTNGLSVSWNPSRPTGYGSAPGYRLFSVTTGGNVAQASAWRGKWPEETGYIWLGARYYDPESGSFLSDDPVWNGRDPNYYSFAGGDPINFFDPDGRFGRNANPYGSYINGIPSGGGTFSERMAWIIAQAGGPYADTSFGGRAVTFGSGLGMTMLGVVPWVNDGIDVYTVGASDSSPLDRAFSSVSLTANMWTLGVAPNYAPIKTGLSRMADAFRSAPTPHAPNIPTPVAPPTRVTPPSTPHSPSGGEAAPSGGFDRNKTVEGFQDHHIISDKNPATMNHELIDSADFDLQSRANKMFLPTDASLHQTRSIHSGRHYGSVSENLGNQMDEIVEFGRQNNWTQEQYNQALHGLISQERELLRSGQRALNRNARPGAQ